jgi:hypothetical protein
MIKFVVPSMSVEAFIFPSEPGQQLILYPKPLTVDVTFTSCKISFSPSLQAFALSAFTLAVIVTVNQSFYSL